MYRGRFKKHIQNYGNKPNKSTNSCENLLNSHWYNFTPLFVHIQKHESEFEDISDYLEYAGEMIPQLSEGDEFNPLLIKSTAYEVNCLKRGFRKIKPLME